MRCDIGTLLTVQLNLCFNYAASMQAAEMIFLFG